VSLGSLILDSYTLQKQEKHIVQFTPSIYSKKLFAIYMENTLCYLGLMWTSQYPKMICVEIVVSNMLYRVQTY